MTVAMRRPTRPNRAASLVPGVLPGGVPGGVLGPRARAIPGAVLGLLALLAPAAVGAGGGQRGDDPPPVAPTATNTPAGAIEATDWQLAAYRTAEGLKDAVADPRGALRFSNGRLSGSVGCNRLVGGYRVDGDRLIFEPHTASTMMACPEPLMRQEQAAVAAFEQAAGFRIKGDRLVITDAKGEVLLRFNARAALSLTETRWWLTAYNNGRGGVQSIAANTETSLQIGADGQFAGRACNTFRGAFDLDGAALRLIGGIAATRMLCAEPAAANDQEAAFFAALERVARWEIDGNRLTLRDAEDATQAQFTTERP